jgi:hypothetical protein
MNAKRAKRLRRLAESTARADAPEREIVGAPFARTSALNSPQSVRGWYRALKKAQRRADAGHSSSR